MPTSLAVAPPLPVPPAPCPFSTPPPPSPPCVEALTQGYRHAYIFGCSIHPSRRFVATAASDGVVRLFGLGADGRLAFLIQVRPLSLTLWGQLGRGWPDTMGSAGG